MTGPEHFREASRAMKSYYEITGRVRERALKAGPADPADPQTRAEMEALPLLLQKAQAHATMAQVIATIQAAWWRAANTGPSPEWLQAFREEL